MLSLIGGLLLSGLVSRQVSRGKKGGREEGEVGGKEGQNGEIHVYVQI